MRLTLKLFFLTLFLILCTVLTACSKKYYVLQGYVEGQLIYLSSSVPGNLKLLGVYRGDHIVANQFLFGLDPYPETAQLDEARFQLKSAQESLANLMIGQRQTVLESIVAQQAQADANYKLAKITLERDRKLYQIQSISKTTLDEAVSNFLATQQRVKEVEANLAEAKLGARVHLILQQQANVNAEEASVARLSWQLAQKTVQAPLDARVVDTYFKENEYVPAGQAVLSILPAKNIKLIFYLPEPWLSQFKIGDKVKFKCDGCKEKTEATIAYISPQAEYTPPIIYSRDTREKLVFRIEAFIDPKLAVQFNAGQPVDVWMK